MDDAQRRNTAACCVMVDHAAITAAVAPVVARTMAPPADTPPGMHDQIVRAVTEDVASVVRVRRLATAEGGGADEYRGMVMTLAAVAAGDPHVAYLAGPPLAG